MTPLPTDVYTLQLIVKDRRRKRLVQFNKHRTLKRKATDKPSRRSREE